MLNILSNFKPLEFMFVKFLEEDKLEIITDKNLKNKLVEIFSNEEVRN